ncbi:MAG: uroporphyrinogen-III synthase [Ghiorsea sp.]
MSFLTDKNILLTRTAEQNEATAALVKTYGAKPTLFPCIDILYLTQALQRALTELKQADKNTTAIIFSSSNGVLALASCVQNLAQTLEGFSIVAVGRKTADALQCLNITTHILPDEASQQGLIQAYRQRDLPKQAFFFRAEEGSNDLADFFTTQNVSFTLVPSYQAKCVKTDGSDVQQQLKHGDIDAVLLGSAKTAGFYVQRIADLSLANSPLIAVMSPQVAQAADKLGLDVQVIAKNPSFKAMLDGLEDHFATKV